MSILALAATGVSGLVLGDGLVVAVGAGATAVAVLLAVLWQAGRNENQDRTDDRDW